MKRGHSVVLPFLLSVAIMSSLRPFSLNGAHCDPHVQNRTATQTALKAVGSGVGSGVLVSVEIKPDRIDDFLKAMEDDATKSRDKPGCLRFDLLRDRDHPNKFVFYECYKDNDAAAYHKTTPHYNSWTEFKKSGGVIRQAVVKIDTTSIPGGWAFQTESSGTAPTGSAVMVTVQIKPGRVDDFLKALEYEAIHSRDKTLDPGCLRFDVLRDQEDPCKFVFYQAYVDDAAAAHHKTTLHYKSWAIFIKASGGVSSQAVVKLETASIPGSWAFQV